MLAVTPDILLILFILAAAVVLLVFEWIPMEVTALLALGAVALTGLVPPAEALSGFSSPAVVTVWAVFILSGGLTQTGVANIIGKVVLKLAGRREPVMIAVIMASAGVMSALMNNVAVAALMLPVVMDIARQTDTAPSRLLMPLAYGSLLGGLTTQIGTPPNILVTEALRDASLTPFSFFDFTPVGLVIMAAGIAFMVFVGRHLLPDRNPARETSAGGGGDWKQAYALQDRLFHIHIAPDSPLVGKSLAQSRIGSALALNVIGITREDQTLVAPSATERLEAGDLLTVEGHLAEMRSVQNWRLLSVEPETVDVEALYTDEVQTARFILGADSPLVGKSLNIIGFRAAYKANVLAIRREKTMIRTGLQDIPLEVEDELLVAGRRQDLESLASTPGTEAFGEVTRRELVKTYGLQERLLVMQVPFDSALVGSTLKETRLGAALGSHILGILRKEGPVIMPEPFEKLKAGDRLLVEGRPSDLDLLRGLEQLQIDPEKRPDLEEMMTRHYGLVEAILSPHSTLAGKTLRQLNFREKYGVNVLAVWREGAAIYENLRDAELRFGDALLVFGPGGKLRMLGQEPDFIVLTETAQQRPRMEKAKLSVLIMAGVILPVVFGWVPIYIAAVVGAALMVLSGSLTMEEAYRQIEWKAVFLIAGMLPLGVALDNTGAARLIAEAVVGLAGPFGPVSVMAALVALTFLSTCFIPTAALVVLMAPIVMNTALDLGLSQHSLLMAVAMAASASFTTPIAHPANILVMGPGGYRFVDYLKVGGLLTLVVFAVIVFVLPFFWPMTGGG
jgi:di/tricarboxylate transporter